MKYNDRVKIYDELVKKNGINYQVIKAIEELSELTVELIKFTQTGTVHRNMVEEMADVKVVFEALEHHFDLNSKINMTMNYKLNRLKAFELE